MAVWSEVNTSNIFGAIRLDAEFYQPRYQENESKLRTFGHLTTLGQITPKFVKGIFDINAEEYTQEGIPFVRISNLRDMFISDRNLAFISLERHLMEPKTALKKFDIVISKTAIPAASLVQVDECNTSQDIIAVQTNRSPQFNFYLVAFLNSRFGLLQMERLFQGNIQSHLSLEEARTILVPLPDEGFEREIADLMNESMLMREQSSKLYSEAEMLLLDTLGLNDLNATNASTYERDFQEVASAGRFDAQYYHPEKYEVLEALKPMSGENIGDLFKSLNQIVDANDDFASEVQNYDLTDALQFFLPDIAPMPIVELGSNKKRFRRGDVVISRLRSYLKEIAIVEATSLACVGSTEFFVLRPRSEQVLSELLLVYLRSEPVQKILRWCQDGSQHPRFKEDELLSIKLPDRLLTIQDVVKDKVREAIQTFYDAQNLLEAAKRRVEELIEEAA
jgi:type I restriction enzyme S subunit